MSRTLFSPRAGHFSLWLGGAALAFGMFVSITKELLEGDVGAMDSPILLAVAKKRTPWLTIAAVDVTALGSIGAYHGWRLTRVPWRSFCD